MDCFMTENEPIEFYPPVLDGSGREYGDDGWRGLGPYESSEYF